MTRRIILVLLALWVSGCAAKGRIVVRPVEVKVPVATPCISVNDIPVQPFALPPMPADTNAALSLALVNIFAWREYGFVADGLLKACAGIAEFHPAIWQPLALNPVAPAPVAHPIEEYELIIRR